MKIFARIRFAWGALVIFITVGFIMIPLIMLFNRHKMIIMHYLNRGMIFLMGGKIEIKGNMDSEAEMFLFNHQGVVDIMAMEAQQKRHLRWVAKIELFDLPWFGYLLKYGDMICIDRDDKKGLIQLLKDVKESLEEKGRPVAIFPEGTRVDEQEMLPFKQGSQMIANKLGLKVQPVVITGSKQLLNQHDYTAHSATVRYMYLPSVEVKEADSDWLEKIRTNMQKVIDDEYTHDHRSR